jgi:hypothetical protein
MEELELIQRLSKDLKNAASTLSAVEARYLVDSYYVMQRNRIRAGNQIHAMTTSNEPHATLRWFNKNADLLERNIKNALDAYGNAHMVGRWSKSIVGIGPVISAGLIAHIDITKAITAGDIWRFAGLDPTSAWEKGEKRPWNASLKTLCWKIGESFVKVSGHEKDVYGHLYLQRKDYEIAKNDTGVLTQQAEDKLKRFKIGKNTEAYKYYSIGKLPPAHIHARAKRWAVKIFLAHWQAVAYREHFGKDAPKPYIMNQPEHVHEIVCPNWPF